MEETIKKKESLVGNVVLNNIYHVLILLIPLITAPYISRVLLSAGVGIKSYTNTYLLYFSKLAGLGTMVYGTRTIARLRDDKIKMSKAFWEIELLTFCSTLISLVGWCFLCYGYKDYSTYLWLWTFSIISVLFDISWLYAGLEKFKYTILVTLVVRVTYCILTFLLIKTPDDTGKYILLTSLSTLVNACLLLPFLPKVICLVKPNLANLGFHFKQTLVYFLPAIAVSVYTVLDKTLIGLITQNDSYNGYYEQATKIIDICKTVSFIGINGVATSRASYLFRDESNNKEEIKRLTDTTLQFTSFFSIAISFGLIGINAIFVPIFFGSGYDMTTDILYYLAPLVFIISISNVSANLYYTPVGKQMAITLFLVIGSVVNLILNIILISLLGPIGACISTLISESLISIICVIFCKTIGWKQIFKIIWKKIIAGCIMLAIIFILNRYCLIKPILLLIIDILLGASIFVILLALLKDESVIIVINKIKSIFRKKENNDEKRVDF